MDQSASSKPDPKKGLLIRIEGKDNLVPTVTFKWKNFDRKQGEILYKKLQDRCDTDCVIVCGPIDLPGHQSAFRFASLRLREAFDVCLRVKGGKKCTKGYKLGLDRRFAPFIHDLARFMYTGEVTISSRQEADFRLFAQALGIPPFMEDESEGNPVSPQLSYVTIAEADEDEQVVIEVNVQRNKDKKPSSPVKTPVQEEQKPFNISTVDEILAKQIALNELKKSKRSRKSYVPVRLVSQAEETNPTKSNDQTTFTRETGAVPKIRRPSSSTQSTDSQSPPIPVNNPYYNPSLPVNPAMLPFLPPMSQYQGAIPPFQYPFGIRPRPSSTVTSPSQTSSPSPTESMYPPTTSSLLQTAAAQHLSNNPLASLAPGSRQHDQRFVDPNVSTQSSLLLMGLYSNAFRNISEPQQSLLQQIEAIKALEMHLGSQRSPGSFMPNMQQQQKLEEHEAMKNLLAAQFAHNMRQHESPRGGANAFPEPIPGPSGANANPPSPVASSSGANAFPGLNGANAFPGNDGALNLSRDQNQPKKGKGKSSSRSPKSPKSPKSDEDPATGKRKRGIPPNYVRDENGEIVYSKSGKAKIRCEICGRILTDPSSLYRHRKTHTDDKAHECKICNSKHIQRFNMKQHTVTHIGYPIDLSIINSMDADLRGIMQGVRRHIKPEEFWKRVEKAKTKMRQAVIRQLARNASDKNASVTPESQAQAFAELEERFRRAEAVYGPTQAALAAEDQRLAEAARAEERAQYAPMVIDEGAEEAGPSNRGTPEELDMDAQDMDGVENGE